MIGKHLAALPAALIACLLLYSSSLAGEALGLIKETTEEIVAIVTNPDLKDPSKEEQRRRLIREAVDKRFDWDEMARRSLGRHWKKFKEEEQKEFVALFGKLLERTYIDRVEGYSGEKVVYGEERRDGPYSIVPVSVYGAANEEIPVQYRLSMKDGTWSVYDVSIAGVSLVSNYRGQFNSILTNASTSALLEKLREKTAGE